MFFNDKINSRARAAIGWTTTGTEKEAKSLAQELVETGLARCAQISGPISSVYTWKDRIETEMEYRITLKFLSSRAKEIEAYLLKHHSYEEPQWIWIEAADTSEGYGKWLAE